MYEKAGLSAFEDHAEKILIHAREEYSKKDRSFEAALHQQELQFQKEMQDLWTTRAQQPNIPLRASGKM